MEGLKKASELWKAATYFGSFLCSGSFSIFWFFFNSLVLFYILVLSFFVTFYHWNVISSNSFFFSFIFLFSFISLFISCFHSNEISFFISFFFFFLSFPLFLYYEAGAVLNHEPGKCLNLIFNLVFNLTEFYRSFPLLCKSNACE